MLRLKAKELSDDPSFKASSGWYEKWKRRHLVSMRTKTTLAQQLPADLEENIVWFHRFVIAARKCGDYPLSRIYNMDETPMSFELPEPNTGIQWEPKSASKILRSRKAELHCRSCCCCQWSKGAPQKSSSKASIHQEIFFHKKGWMDEQGMKQRNIDVTTIPGGLTPVVQPLDKCLNKPFKDNVH